MSKYRVRPLDLSGLKTIPIAARGGKVRTADFGVPYSKGSGVAGWLDSLPKILAGDSFRFAVEALVRARSAGKPIIWGMGGHVIKCGLAPVLADLMRRGFATAFTMNGSAAIHDFEIAIAGQTSEDVEAVLPDGRFGSAEETGREMNEAIAAAAGDSLGMGEALGARLARIADPAFVDRSLLLQAYNHGIPVTVHVAIGTDTPHTHPAANAAAIGSTTHHDFRLFCSLVAGDERRRRLFERRLGCRAAGGLPQSRFRGSQSGSAAGRVHHHQSRLPATLSPQGERGRKTARQRRRPRYCSHRTS